MREISVGDFPGLDFGDKRRDQRFVSIINNIVHQPGASIPRQNSNWYDTKATYKFLSNEQVSINKLRQAIADYGASQLPDLSQMLIVHDMTNVSFGALEAKGLGYTDDPNGNGFLCFNSMAVTTTGLPLSLLHQHTWIRERRQRGKAKDKKKIPFEDKESYEWKRAVDKVNNLIGGSIHKIHIADRQSDIYELFFCPPEQHSDLLIRAHVNRKLMCGDFLWPSIADKEPQWTINLTLPEVKGGKKTTTVQATVRYSKVEIRRPVLSKSDFASLTLTAIEVTQTGTLKGRSELVNWKLLTTLEVKSVADVLCYVRWYSYRWLIERFHYVLKGGTRIQELQLKEAASLQKALHLYSLAAFRVMLLVYESRHHPQTSCDLVLTREQWQTLYLLVHKDDPLPEEPPGLEQAVKWIGRLGGHLGRKSDGPPGLKTVWLGYQRLRDATEIFKTLSQNLGKE